MIEMPQFLFIIISLGKIVIIGCIEKKALLQDRIDTPIGKSKKNRLALSDRSLNSFDMNGKTSTFK